MAWCKLEDSFRDHRKPKRLAKLLGISHAEARGLCAGLWSWALTQAPDGDLRDFSTDEIEDAADWGGEPGALIDALASDGVGLLDLRGDEYEIHEYLERAESYKKATAKRVERDRKKAEAAAAETVAVQSSDCRETVSPRGEERRREEMKGEDQSREEKKSARGLADSVSSAVIDDIWSWYKRYHPRAGKKMGAKEQKLCRARLKSFTPDDIKEAIDGYHRSPFHCGQNDTGSKHQSIELILRENGKVQKGIEMANNPNLGSGMTEKTRKNISALQQWAEDKKNEPE